MKENEIQKQILKTLESMGIFAWRNNTGGRGKLRFGIKGQADITGILNGGRRLEIEVKGLGGKISKEQYFFLETINRFGGLAFVARSVDDLIENLKVGK